MRDSEPRHALAKRGSSEQYRVNIGANVGIIIIGLAYPPLVDLFGPNHGAAILRNFFRLIRGYCTGETVQVAPIPANPGQSDFTGYQTEHPIDRQVMGSFAKATCSGILESGERANIPTLDRQLFWRTHFSRVAQPVAALAAERGIGGVNGPRSGYVNDRIMESFGSEDYRDPFMAVENRINGPKGRAMALRAPTGLSEIRRRANEAVQQDTNAAADVLLQEIRAVSRKPLTLPASGQTLSWFDSFTFYRCFIGQESADSE